MSKDLKQCRKDLNQCRIERQQLKEENAALKQKMFEMTSFSRGRIAELSRAGDGKSKPASYYTADAVLRDLGVDAHAQGDLGLGAQKQGGRRKTRKKKRSRKKKNRRKRRKTRRKSARAGYTPDFYKKSVEQPLE